MGGIAVGKSDDQWETESDASTLREAEVIKTDSKRFKKAVKELKKQMGATQKAVAAVNASAGLKKTFTS